MGRILLLLEHKENRRLLSEWLATRYQVFSPDSDLGSQDQKAPLLEQSFDLCILDARALDRNWEWVQATRQAQQPVFLPFLLITSRQDVRMVTRHLWQSIDDLITKPIEKVELQARVEIHLRSRQYSMKLKAAEEEILNALNKERELNELKSRFVSMVSHEFRNPLNRISGAAQLLERYSEQWSQEKKQEFFGRIKTGVKEMTELLEDVLVIGTAEVGRLEVNPAPLELEKFSRNLVEEIKLSTGGQHRIDFVTQGQCTNACLDEKLLRHILTNLLTNAVKYSPQGSTIHFNLICQDQQARFQIQDEGIGIPLEDQKRLFESFHRAANVKNFPGTGLGLAIVKRYVDLQGGAIAFTSQVGVGTTFTVTLPMPFPYHC